MAALTQFESDTSWREIADQWQLYDVSLLTRLDRHKLGSNAPQEHLLWDAMQIFAKCFPSIKSFGGRLSTSVPEHPQGMISFP
jgi:hypothetical protein